MDQTADTPQMDEKTRDILLDLWQFGADKKLLARKHGVTVRTMHRRIAHMISNGQIKLVVTPNPVAMGYKAWARIGITVAPGELENVAKILVDDPEIFWVVYTIGRFDIMISVQFERLQQLTDFINMKLMRIEGIADIETIIQVAPRKYVLFDWPSQKSVSRKEKE